MKPLMKKEDREEYEKFVNEELSKLNREFGHYLIKMLGKFKTLQNRCINKLNELVRKDGT
jgi:predicted aldo/keto reductase-like oxidoreductase